MELVELYICKQVQLHYICLDHLNWTFILLTLSSLITYICSSDNSGMEMLHVLDKPVISHGEGQCLSKVIYMPKYVHSVHKKVLRANPEALLRFCRNTVLPQGINKGSHLFWQGGMLFRL